jgi:multidrug efflux pump subunit AcrB
VVVFLCLAALYESWSIPVAVLMAVPLGLLGMAAFCREFNVPNDIYFKIGMVTVIGLAAKNAILIVEFAKLEYDRGKPLLDATLEGARLRLRPILMTAFAFILGCVPLWTASGAGGISRQVLGTVVIGGMLAASIIAIFFIPVSYEVVERFTEKFGGKKKEVPQGVPVDSRMEGDKS